MRIASRSIIPSLANSLRAGDLVKDAYFDAHKDYYNGNGHQAVIAASPKSCCATQVINGKPTLVCPDTGCSGDYLHGDTWSANNAADLPSGSYYFVTEWVDAQ